MKTTNSNGSTKVRTLKVYDKFFRRSYDHAVYPEIRLIGKWLQDCGFRPGQHITVITAPDRLIITHSNASEVSDTLWLQQFSNHKQPVPGLFVS